MHNIVDILFLIAFVALLWIFPICIAYKLLIEVKRGFKNNLKRNVTLSVILLLILVLNGVFFYVREYYTDTPRVGRCKAWISASKTAIQVYGLDNEYSKVPNSLNDLVPVYLDTVPIVGLEPVEYEKLSDTSYTLSCISLRKNECVISYNSVIGKFEETGDCTNK